eukprot:4738110-Prorocentrum_lima.AAC.1
MYEYPGWHCKVGLPRFVDSLYMPPDRLALPNDLADSDDKESFKVGLVRCPEISGFNRDDLIALGAKA